MDKEIFFILCNYLAFMGFSFSITNQIIYVIKNRETKRILLRTSFIRLFSFILFITYLIDQKMWHIVITSSSQMLLTIILIVIVIYYRKYKNNNIDNFEYYELE